MYNLKVLKTTETGWSKPLKVEIQCNCVNTDNCPIKTVADMNLPRFPFVMTPVKNKPNVATLEMSAKSNSGIILTHFVRDYCSNCMVHPKER